MLAGVNMVESAGYRAGDAERRYLRRFLATARAVQNNTQFVVFTNTPGETSVCGWETVSVEAHGGVLGALPVRGTALDHVLRRHQVDVVLSPLEAATAVSSTPQVLLALGAGAWESDAGGAGAKRSSALKPMKKACANARAVIAASEYVRRRCLELFDVPLDKSIVAPAGVDPVFEKPQSPIVAPPYFLIFRDENTSAYVNRLIEALNNAREEFPQTLVVAGERCGNEPEEWDPRIVRIEQCPDSTLAGLYQHCAVFIQPSVHDGSALRVLEAVRAGAAVISPHARAVEELAGNAVFYYNWESPASFLATLRRAFDLSEEQRKERIHLGRMAMAKYAWDKTAWKILAALKRD